MSMDFVGRENLPNIYIKEISVDKYGASKLLIKPMVYIKDIKDGNSKFQWYENTHLRKNMKVMILVSSSESFNNTIESGNYSGGFTPKNVSKITGYDKDSVYWESRSLQNIDKKKMAQSAERVDGGLLYTFGYGCKFIIPNGANISVFAVCYLDVQQFSLENDIDLAGGAMAISIGCFHGAIAGESVIKQNKVQDKTNLFFDGDRLWTGPVHSFGQGFMAGSKHSSKPHSILVKKQILNTKIKDYRVDFKKKPKTSRLNAQQIPIFSSLYTSHNKNGNIASTFMMNMKQFFIQRTKYGNLLQQVNDEVFNTMLSKINLNKLVVQREDINPSKVTSPSGTVKEVAGSILGKKIIIQTEDISPYKLKNKYRYYSSKKGRSTDVTTKKRKGRMGDLELKSFVKGVSLNKYGLEVRGFSFTDMELDFKAHGAYRYTISLELKDPTADYVKEMCLELKQGFTAFKLYKEGVEKRTNYDYNLDKTKESFVRKQTGTGWAGTINTYLKYYDLLFESTQEEIQELGRQAISMINPRSATTKSLNSFYFEYGFLLNYFMKYFEYSDSVFNSPNSRGNVKIDPNRGKIQIEHQFDDIIRFSHYKKRLTYLRDRWVGSYLLEVFPRLNYTDVRALSIVERRKYFIKPPRFNRDVVPALLNDHLAITALNDLETYQCSYYSPRTLYDNTDRFDLSSITSLQPIPSFNSFYNKFIKTEVPKSAVSNPADTAAQEIINRTNSSYYIKPVTINKGTEEDEYPAQNIVGEDSNFVPSSMVVNNIGNNLLDSDIGDMFSSYESNMMSSNTIDAEFYDIQNTNNAIAAIVNSNNYNSSMFAKLPLQIKALMASKYSWAVPNFLNSEIDMLSSSLTKDLVNILFFTIAEMQYLDGFEVGSNGELNLKKPIWKIYTTNNHETFSESRQLILCRMRFYSNQNIKISTPLMASYNIENEFFYVGQELEISLPTPTTNSSEDKNTNLLSFYGSLEEANEFPVEYAQSIIVIQTNDKNGPLKFIDYGVQQTELQQVNDFTKPAGGSMPPTGGGSY